MWPPSARPCPTMGSSYFFFQAEDGIRDLTVTGVQTCALPILSIFSFNGIGFVFVNAIHLQSVKLKDRTHPLAVAPGEVIIHRNRSEEHTSELQSQSNLVCRLLLEKKKSTEA